jgi:hypothetical protein
MAASASDLLQEVGLATATTLDANYTIADTTVTVVSTSGWPTATGITFAIDTIDSNGEQVPGTYNEFVGTVASATSISNVDWVDGVADTSYSAGATTRVYIPVSKTRENRIVTHGLAHANQDGTLKDDTVGTDQLVDLNVTTAKLADASVTDEKQKSTVAFKATNVTVKNVPTWPAQIVMDSEVYDLGTNYDAPTSTFTAPFDGIFHFDARLNRSGTASFIILALYVDRGSGYVEEYRGGQVDGTLSSTGVVATTDLKLDAGDEVQLWGGVNTASSGFPVTLANANFNGHCVGRV